MSIYTLILVLAMPALIALTIFKMWPAAFRARFVRDVSNLRDRIDDSVILGDLPAGSEANKLLDRCQFLIEDPRRISFALLLAVHMAHEELGQELSTKGPTYANLTPSQRRLIHKYEADLTELVTSHIVHGSRMCVPLWVIRQAMRPKGGIRAVVTSTPRPQQLASEWTHAKNPRKLANA